MTESVESRMCDMADPAAVSEALWALRSGQVVVFPTDTVYGVGCDLWQPKAIERLYWVKNRSKALPIPVLVSAPEQVLSVAQNLPTVFHDLVERFWPGGLTLIVPRRPYVPDVLCAGGPTVAVRMPHHLGALRLIAEMGGALAATSANLSGFPSPQTAFEAYNDLKGRVPIVLDGGRCPGGVASAIVDLVSEQPVLLRQGDLEMGVLRRVLPDLIVARRV